MTSRKCEIKLNVKLNWLRHVLNFRGQAIFSKLLTENEITLGVYGTCSCKYDVALVWITLNCTGVAKTSQG